MTQKVVKAVLVAGAVFVVLALWGVWAFLQPILARNGYCWTFAELGTWGDSFGALTSLFTAIGFITVASSFFLQRKQLANAERSEKIERFETLYFEIMGLIREVRKDVRFRYRELYTEATGHNRKMVYDSQAFRYAWREIAFFFERSGEKLTQQETISLYHEVIHDRFESGFAPYFRSVYTILRRIDDETALSNKEKEFFANLVRSQLGSYELAVIGLNALSHVSGDFKYYLTKYRMLKYLPEDTTRLNILRPHYDEIAFKGRDD